MTGLLEHATKDVIGAAMDESLALVPAGPLLLRQ
jgi:hypothetical protein